MKPAIAVENLSKMYRLGGRTNGGYRTLRETITDTVAAPWQRLRRFAARSTTQTRSASEAGSLARALGSGGSAQSDETLWALKDISFEIEQGEVVGVVGRNGAGKSTMLKIVSRITEPTSGRVRFRGRVGSLLEVGTGFHHELTGRENIYLNGAICGMTRREITRKFDEIVAFAEVDQFLDTPVKRYSSGMFVRLAFAVASHMEPEVLLVDEVLAVGDAAFQKKCLGKMNEVSRTGRTVLFVSHNMATIVNLCEKVVLLDRGRLSFVGPCQEGIARYMEQGATQGGGEADLTDHPNRRNGSKPVLGKVRLVGGNGQATDQILCGEPVTIEVDIHPQSTVNDPQVAVGFDDTFGCRLFTAATYLTDPTGADVLRAGRAVCQLDQLPLTPGRYCITLNAGPLHAAWTDVIDQVLWFDVIASDFYGNGRHPNPDWGRFLVRSRWTTGK